MYTPVNPSFTILKWGVRGNSLHGHVFVMSEIIRKEFHIVSIASVAMSRCNPLGSGLSFSL